MSVELADLTRLVANEHVEKEVVAGAIQALLYHQVIYDDTSGVPKKCLAAIRNNRDFFARYFAAAGFNLRIDAREQMVAIEVDARAYGNQKLHKDDTLVRLALRLMLDDGLRLGVMDEHGRVASDTDELVDMFRQLGGAEVPSESRLHEVLNDLQRRGAVRMAKRDRAGSNTQMTILPGLRIYVPDAFIEQVADWVSGGCPGDDVFSHLTEQRQAARTAAVDDDDESAEPHAAALASTEAGPSEPLFE